MSFHNIGENALFTTVAAGTFINAQNAGGTAGGVVNAGLYEQHLVAFLGTLGNTGTINVYGCTNSAGSSPNLLASLTVGSAAFNNGHGGAGIMVKSDVLNSLQGGTSGTAFTHLAAAGTVDTGGTWRGALVIISTQPRTGGTTGGLSAIGSALY
jgi:hypothetical protein